jgi:hypothetical protein
MEGSTTAKSVHEGKRGSGRPIPSIERTSSQPIVQRIVDKFPTAGLGGGLSRLWRSCKTRRTGRPQPNSWPPVDSPFQRRVLLHAGLHKTGTTALQRFLSGVADELRGKGFLYPQSGRPQEAPDAQHNIAWQLGGDRRFRPSAGSLDDLAIEVSSFPGDAVVSSEDFESILGTPERFLPLFKHPLLKGHAFTIVFWVRDQASYLESLFFEMLHHRMAQDALRFCEAALTDGQIRHEDWIFHFDYMSLRAGLLELPATISLRPTATLRAIPSFPISLILPAWIAPCVKRG